MPTHQMTVTVPPDSELGRALADPKAEVVLESGGVRYTVNPEDVFAHYDVEAVLEGLRRSRGALTGVDTEALLADLAEQRSQDSSGRPG